MRRASPAVWVLAFALVFAPAECVPAFAAQAQDTSGQSGGQSGGETKALPDAPQPSPDRPSSDQPNQSQPTPSQESGGATATAPSREPPNSAPPPANSAVPGSSPKPDSARKPEPSSSDQSRGDISPPEEDELAHPDAYGAAPGPHEWNPLRAMKDVEVGTFYYNAGNYKAAISRFREALEFKPRDAVATFKLAQALEKSGDLSEARAQYEAYLAILKDGPSAGEAMRALRRLKK
jgi:tetratricopeptide (TPR) repeat protein